MNAIVNSHEKIFDNKRFVYIKGCAEKNKSLIVSMSTHNGGERYFGFRALIDSQSADLLFVTDPNNSYYLEDDEGDGYKRLFLSIVSNYAPNRVSFFGSSMAGYAALYHSSFFGANAIVSNPQLNFAITLKNCWSDLKKTINKLSYKSNLEENDIFL